VHQLLGHDGAGDKPTDGTTDADLQEDSVLEPGEAGMRFSVAEGEWLYLTAWVCFAVLVGFSAYQMGADARRCAIGPSPEEETMRQMHQECSARSGIWAWRFDKKELDMSAYCLGGE
jgi:hypothetical protein